MTATSSYTGAGWAMHSTSSSTSAFTSTSSVSDARSARIRIGISLLQGRQRHAFASASSSPSSAAQLLQLNNINMPIHAVHLGGAPCLTTSHVLAADFRAWNYRVDTYAHNHHNVLALLAMQRAEGFDQTTREAELMDVWCAEWVGRWGFEARVGAMLGEQEDLRASTRRTGRWDLGAAVGMAGNNFTEEVRAVKAGRGMRWGLEGVRAWFGGGLGRRNGDAVVEGVCGDGEALPPYTKGEDPPAYEQ